MKLYDYKTEYAVYKNCRIETDRYSYNNALAIELVNDEDGPITRLTVCIDHDRELNPDESFVDTNNNPDAEEFIIQNQLGEPTGEIGYSGWCQYPLYRFNLDKIKN